MLNICHITSMHDWNDDRIFERACYGLSVEGYQVSLIATSDKTEKSVVSGVEIIPIKKRSGLKRRVLSSFEATKKAASSKSDILHFHDPDLLPFMWVLSWFKKGVVYDIHENYMARIWSLQLPNFLKSFLSFLWRSFEKICIRSFDGFVVTTDSMGKMFNIASVPYCVVSNTPYLKRLDLDKISNLEKRTGINLYISGSHSKQRNCMQAVEALPLIVSKNSDVNLVFAGKYVPESFKEDLRRRAEELGVSAHLHLEGMLPWLENFNRTSSMHIGLVLYEDNLNNRVTIPNRLFEYMISGLAVVGESFIEVKNVVEDAECGYTCNSSKPEEIASAVIQTIEDKRGLLTLGMSGKNAILNKYAFEYDLERLIQYYNSITKKRS